MKEKLKSPKGSDNKLLSNDVESTLIGTLILLVSLIGLLGKGPVGEFLQYCIVFLFGNFYFLVFAYLIFISLYLIVTKKLFVLKLNLYLLSAILVLFSFLIGASQTSVDLTISNFSSSYINVLNATPGISLFSVQSLEAISYTGGGYIGYLLRGFLNTCFTEIGTSIAIGIFAFVGLSIFIKDIVIFFIKFFKKLYEKRQKDEKSSKNKVVPIVEKNDDIKDEISEENLLVKEEVPFHEEEQISNPIESNDTSVNTPQTMELFIEDTTIEKEINKGQVSSIVDIEEIKEAPKPSIDIKEEIVPIVAPSKVIIKEEKPSFFNDFNDSKNLNEEKDKVESVPPINEGQIGLHEEEKPKFHDYVYPSLSLLSEPQNDDVSMENRIVAENRLNKINEVFSQFKIGANAISYTIGPSCTRFNIKMNPGVKVNSLSTIQNEIAIALGGIKTVRLELVVEGRDTSSFEIGNTKIASVSFKECIQSLANKTSSKDKLLVPLGKGIEGDVVTVSLDDLPHLLVAGTTGSGKSVFINTVITTLLMRNKPDELKLMLIDPKKIEFSKYNDLPHLLCPVITEGVEGKNALKRLVDEMERRYTLFLTKGKGCTKLSEFNELADALGYEKLPNIVMVCDEFSDFMSEYGKEIEPLVKRLAQKARACGIYLIICTQRPSVNVITGDIKAVVPSRIALLVPSLIDSRTILDEGGAESLLGNGDMLCRIPRHNSLVRVQGAYIKSLEIIKICDAIKAQGNVDYDPNFTNLVEQNDLGIIQGSDDGGINRRERDVLHEQVKKHVIETRIASTSNLQSRFGIGYARADHILNCLQDEGVITRSGNGNRRIVVMTLEEYEKKQNEE